MHQDKIKNLCKNFNTLKAVDNLSLEVFEGETFALLGLNGAGKSTTINILCGLLQKTSGEIEVEKYYDHYNFCLAYNYVFGAMSKATAPVVEIETGTNSEKKEGDA